MKSMQLMKALMEKVVDDDNANDDQEDLENVCHYHRLGELNVYFRWCFRLFILTSGGIGFKHFSCVKHTPASIFVSNTFTLG